MFLQAAFNLTRLGWAVFPIQQGGKAPAIPSQQGGRGCLDATTDEEVISNWARRYPRANIGIACGALSRITVIDLDPRNGSDKTIAQLKAKGKEFPVTVTARTANGGTHLYYAYVAGLKNSKEALGAGIDLKNDRGYVVAPPSVLDGGRAYDWERSPLGDCLPPLPKWAVEVLKPRPEPVRTASGQQADGPKDISPLLKFVAEAPSGNRNNYLWWGAWKAACKGQLSDSAKDAFRQTALSIGLDPVEVEKTLASAAKSKRLA